jgi:hypothetical protein
LLARTWNFLRCAITANHDEQQSDIIQQFQKFVFKKSIPHCKKSVLKIQEYIHEGANLKFYIPEFFNFKSLIPEYSPIYTVGFGSRLPHTFFTVIDLPVQAERI